VVCFCEYGEGEEFIYQLSDKKSQLHGAMLEEKYHAYKGISLPL
jgi:hypothetical protein